MRVVPIAALFLAVVMVMLLATEVSTLEDSIVADSTGALATFADRLSLLWVLVAGVVGIGAAAGGVLLFLGRR